MSDSVLNALVLVYYTFHVSKMDGYTISFFLVEGATGGEGPRVAFTPGFNSTGEAHDKVTIPIYCNMKWGTTYHLTVQFDKNIVPDNNDAIAVVIKYDGYTPVPPSKAAAPLSLAGTDYSY